MCGITGLLSTNTIVSNQDIFKMTETLKHRGPNKHDVWMDNKAGLALGHTRLSVIELSLDGSQPMVSSNGRWVLVYNGEIYNHDELRRELKSTGCQFRGSSDTEVLLEGCARWGINKVLPKLIGMFAFALWDKQERILHMARDRLGIKPLYWGRFDDLFLFGSELKALRANSGWTPEIDRDSIALYMRHNYIPAPQSIYKNVFKLLPGCILTLKPGKAPQIEEYWSLKNIVNETQKEVFNYTEDEAITALDKLLRDAVGCRMKADVPLGSFLSGGIDSTTVAALMQAQSSRPIKTYSVGFNESGFNEAHHAAVIAKHLGTDHTELYVKPEEALEVIPRLAEIYDEPFADSSQIPTYLVSAMSRQHVTVALSGDGGDECFAGYSRYILARRVQRLRSLLPKSFLSMLATLITYIPPRYLNGLSQVVPDAFRPAQFGDRLHKLAGVFLEEDDAYYRRLISHWTEPETLVLNSKEPKGVVWDPSIRSLVPDFIERMRYLDMLTYLPDDILTKVDRASMAVSLEARVPLLDHRVVEFSWCLPQYFKIRQGEGKWLLKQVLYKYVPKGLVERPKMGFGVPIDSWLRGPLRDWAESLLDEKRLREEGFLNSRLVQEKWRQHLSGRYNYQYLLWNVLMFQAWHERWV